MIIVVYWVWSVNGVIVLIFLREIKIFVGYQDFLCVLWDIWEIVFVGDIYDGY